jgi:hypothetical protein
MNSENWLVWLIAMIYEACAKLKQSPCRHRVKMHGLHYWDIHLGPREYKHGGGSAGMSVPF